MINYQRGYSNESKDLSDLIKTKRGFNKWVLEDLKTLIIDRYGKYDSKLPWRSLAPLKWSEDEKTALISLYDSTVKSSEIKLRLASANLRRCPYCNIGATREIDHFLPQSIYPEYSIKATNLVRLCEVCNGKKSDKIYSKKTKQLLLINPNIESFPDRRFISCRLQNKSGQWDAVYRLINSLSEGNFVSTRMIYHFVEMDLSSRFSELASEEISSIQYRVVKPDYRGQQDKIKEFFTYEKDRWQKTCGANHWKVALYASAANNDEFGAYCSTL